MPHTPEEKKWEKDEFSRPCPVCVVNERVPAFNACAECHENGVTKIQISPSFSTQNLGDPIFSYQADSALGKALKGNYDAQNELEEKILDLWFSKRSSELKEINNKWLSLNLRNDNKENWGKELDKFGVYMQSVASRLEK